MAAQGSAQRRLYQLHLSGCIRCEKKLDAARPDYVPSVKFTTAYQSASSQLAGMDVYSPESPKGKAGQLALDQLVVAYDAILAEDGPVYAAANKSTVTPWIGFTIDTVSNYQANVDLAATLPAPYAWIRPTTKAKHPHSINSALSTTSLPFSKSMRGRSATR
jgi:hypothetical protein